MVDKIHLIPPPNGNYRIFSQCKFAIISKNFNRFLSAMKIGASIQLYKCNVNRFSCRHNQTRVWYTKEEGTHELGEPMKSCQFVYSILSANQNWCTLFQYTPVRVWGFCTLATTLCEKLYKNPGKTDIISVEKYNIPKGRDPKSCTIL